MAGDDTAAVRELERVPLELPAGLEIEWLGVSGYRLTYEGVSIFIDPYVSRVPLRGAVSDGGTPVLTSVVFFAMPVPPFSAGLTTHPHSAGAFVAVAITAVRDQGVRVSVAGAADAPATCGFGGRGGATRAVRARPFVVRFVPVATRAALQSQGADGRRAHLRSPARPLSLGLQVRRRVGNRDRGRRHHLYHQGSANLDDDVLGSCRWTSSSPHRQAQRHTALLGGSCRSDLACGARTTTTSSSHSAGARSLCAERRSRTSRADRLGLARRRRSAAADRPGSRSCRCGDQSPPPPIFPGPRPSRSLWVPSPIAMNELRNGWPSIVTGPSPAAGAKNSAEPGIGRVHALRQALLERRLKLPVRRHRVLLRVGSVGRPRRAEKFSAASAVR